MGIKANDRINSNKSIINTRIEKLLDCFDSNTRDALLDFCRRISSIEADVFILMARKATCFFNCLEELGLIHFNGYVTSERILDMDTRWLCEKSVVIIDDAIVSGTSINRTIDKLKKAGAKSVEVHVLSVNQKWYQPDMLTDDKGNSYLYQNCNVASNEKCIELCYDIVKAILLQPRPYDIDYPFFNRINIKSSNFANVVNRYGWNAFDVSTVEQKNNQIFSITLMPTPETVSKFERWVSCKAFEHCLLKIRLYATFNDKSKKTFSVRVVPMIVFDRIDTKYINQMFEELIRQAGKESLRLFFTSVSAKMRVLQFYFSYKLAMFWAIGLPSVLGVKGSNLKLAERNLSFIFPKEIDCEIEELCQLRDIGFDINGIFDFDQSATSEYAQIDNEKDYISIENKLIEPFIDFYYNKEIPCREIVLKEGKKVFENTDYKELVQRLNKGINIGELMHIIKYAEDIYDIKTRVSLFLDRSIDMGIIVPITQEKSGYVYRAYRHGEDVLFGEREKTLYLYLLREFQKESKRKVNELIPSNDNSTDEGLTHISLEKMMVLFTKIGLEQGVLRPYLLNFTADPNDKNAELEDVLRIKTTLKGPVSLVAPAKKHRRTSKIPYISTESRTIWLSNIFFDKEYISLDKNNKYTVSDIDTSSIVQSDLNKVQDIAILFGQLCNKDINTGVNYGDDELTKISTCLNVNDCIKAVAAELYIFTRQWHEVSFENGFKVKAKYLDDAKDTSYFEALNSACMKVMAYESGEAKKLITDVRFSSRIEQNQWNNWFCDVIQQNEVPTLEENTNSLFFECRRILYSLMILENLLLEALFINFKKREKSKRYKYFFDCEKLICSCRESLSKIENEIPDETKAMVFVIDNFRRTIASACEIKDKKLIVKEEIADITIRNICHCIEVCNDEVEAFLDDVRATYGERGQISKSTIYTHSLAIVYNTDDQDFKLCVEKQVKRCHESILRKVSEYDDTAITLIPENYNPQVCILKPNEKALWMAATGSAAAQIMAIFSMNLLYVVKSECEKKNIEFGGLNVLYMGDIGYQHALRQSESSPTEFICNSFREYIDCFPTSFFRCEEGVLRLKLAIEQKMRDENKFVEFVNSKQTQEKMNCKYIQIENHTYTVDYSMLLSIEAYEMILGKPKTPQPNRKIAKYYSNDDKITENRITEEIDKLMTKVGIITILDEEASAVINSLSMKECNFKLGERLYYQAQIPCENNNNHVVVMTQALAQGAESVAGAYNDMVHKYEPEIIILVGIAGGLNSDVDFGSVVLCKDIISYNLQKDMPDGIQRRGRVNTAPMNIVPLFQRLLRKIEREPLSAYFGSPNEKIQVVIGDIASGDAVIANELSDIRTWIKTYNDKIVACEMEAYGVSSAFYEGQLTPNRTATYCVIRGISDMADSDKNKNPAFRKAAAFNAAIVMKEIIKLLP